MNRPEQIEPNKLELAILDRIATKNLSLRPYLRNLHVLSREFTDVGSYTNSKCEDEPFVLDLQAGSVVGGSYPPVTTRSA